VLTHALLAKCYTFPQWSETIISTFGKVCKTIGNSLKLVTKFEAFDFENSYLTCVSDVCGMTPSVLIMPLLNWKAWGYCDGICDDHDDADEKLLRKSSHFQSVQNQ
jgi:hypothetical protein